MDLMRLAYASVSLVEAVSAEMMDIARTSSRRNPRDNVTGALLFDGSTFFSFLEGDRATVSDLMERIGGDPRHAGLVVVETERADERLFNGWNLRRVEREDDGGLPLPEAFAAMRPVERRALALAAVKGERGHRQ